MDGLIRVKNNPAKKATGKRDLYYYYRREARCTLPEEGELLPKGSNENWGGERKMQRKKIYVPRKTLKKKKKEKVKAGFFQKWSIFLTSKKENCHSFVHLFRGSDSEIWFCDGRE